MAKFWKTLLYVIVWEFPWCLKNFDLDLYAKHNIFEFQPANESTWSEAKLAKASANFKGRYLIAKKGRERGSDLFKGGSSTFLLVGCGESIACFKVGALGISEFRTRPITLTWLFPARFGSGWEATTSALLARAWSEWEALVRSTTYQVDQSLSNGRCTMWKRTWRLPEKSSGAPAFPVRNPTPG